MSEQVNLASDLPEAESQHRNSERQRYRSRFHPLTLGTGFAPSASEQERAESQNHNLEDTHTPPSDEIITGSDKVEINDSPYASHYRPDAPIWSLYLKETEAEDRELVMQWQNGLDTLLVFAGLFAAILTAFLIESHKGLQADPQSVLLQEILCTLRNELNASTPFSPSALSLHVNYLWFISLTFTLIGALGGVLAKGWLAKYAPASPGVSSSDACERHLRAIGAYKWHFSGVISGIPFLIQLAWLKDGNKLVHLAGARAIRELSKQPAWHDTIKATVTQIIILLKDSDSDIRCACADIIRALAQQPLFYDVIESAIAPILEMPKDSDLRVRLVGAQAIETLAEQPLFHDMMKGAVSQIIELFRDDVSYTPVAGTRAIRKLAEQSGYAGQFLDTLLLSLISLIKTGPPLAQSYSMDLLSELPGDALARLANSFTATDLLTVLKCKDHIVSASAARLFCALATQCRSNRSSSMFSEATLNVILYALSCLDHADVEFQACGTSILHVLVDHDAAFRAIVSEVGAIHGFVRMFANDLSAGQQENLLYCLQEVGLLETL